ncbi:MAG: ShlB/FhaC/HecB family hemolysin secretion/activation protein [Pseudomonadota bacterium]|nr:ShlB/FhaC/HecB family hemolysin secretion/activation protein [Pseudomonadota bacterium]
MKMLSRLISGLFLVTAATAGHAATPPDAGSLTSELKASDIPAAKKSLPALDVQQEARPAMKGPEGLKVKVDKFRITGATAYSDAVLQPLVASYLGRELSLAEMEQAAAAISRHYRQNGYFVARAYVPAQDIQTGVLEIAVLEGKVGAIGAKIDSASGKLSEDRAKYLVSGAIQPGDVIHDKSLERGLLLLNDLPGVEVRSTLTPGATTGTSDLGLEVKEGRLFSGSVDLDNFGNKYTGTYRLGGTLNANNLAGLGDLLNVRAMLSDGDMLYGRISYVLPVGNKGAKVGAAYSNMNYELGKDFTSLNADGDANVYSLFGSYPIIRSRNSNLYVTAGYDAKDLVNNANNTVSSDNELRAFNLGVSGDMRDGTWGGGVNNYGLTWTAGDLDRNTITDAVLDAASAKSAGTYNKVNYNFARLQRVSDTFNLYASLQGQLTSKNLDASEKMTMGGPNGVRAYPQGEAASDEGHLLSLEGRWDLPVRSDWGDLQLQAFLDTAFVRLHKSEWAGWQGTNPNAKNAYALAGAGLGLTLSKPSSYAVRASYAFKISDNPGRDASGKDSDNTDDDGRFWFQAVKWF